MVDGMASPKQPAFALPDPKDPAAALPAVVALRAAADRLENAAVRHAVEQGWTWTAIAQTLGVTRQAVHKRHRKRLGDISPTTKTSSKET